MKKFYAVIKGREPGIYRNWIDAKRQVDNFRPAVYKGFKDFEEALRWSLDALAANGYPASSKKKNKESVTQLTLLENEADLMSAMTPDGVIKVYTDGGSRNSGNYLGGHVRSNDLSSWAYRIVTPDGEILSGSDGEYGKTNNKMELKAFEKACERLVSEGYTNTPIMFILDSRYVLSPLETGDLNKWAENNWVEERANKEYWQAIWKYYSQLKDVYFKWVKGHADDLGNNTVDKMVNEAMDKMGAKK